MNYYHFVSIAFRNRGLAKIDLGDKESGCLDLSKAGELGAFESYDLIKKYCNWKAMALYTVYFLKEETLTPIDRHHPQIDIIPRIEYDDDDGEMGIDDISHDESFALKIAGRFWENLKANIYSEEYEASAEDRRFYVINERILKSVFSEKNPYKKIVVKKTG